MLMTIYGRALKVLLKKPLKLWGLSLLSIVLSGVLSALCGIAIPVLGISVGLLIGTSMTIIYLRGYRGEEVNTVQLFECFKSWNTIKRLLLGLGWMYMWIFLWGLIPIVGPIFMVIRAYEYRLTPYILIFEPDVAITDAIKISSQKTKGYKLQMWLADFLHAIIFIGIAIILGLLSIIPFIGILFAIVLILFYLAYIVFVPLFAGIVKAAFYEEINSEAVGYCSKCGTKLTSAANACPKCGTPIDKN